MVLVNEFAFSNLFIISLVVIGGFAFLRVVKKRLEDW